MPQHPLQPYWNLAAAATQAEALDTALALGIFPLLESPLTPGELAHQLNLDATNSAHLLELLWGMALLERLPANTGDDAPRYSLSPVTRRYFLPQSPCWSGDAWHYRKVRLRQAGEQIRQQLSQGATPQDDSSMSRQWAAAARRQLTQDQHAATVPAALEIIATAPELATSERLLDLGGGPGWVAIALARQNPQLTGTVFDFPDAAVVAQENITTSGLESRLQARGGDLAQDDFGGDYDLVWCSSVLHFVSDRKGLLERVFAALRPGGTLVCAHAEIADTPETAAATLQYYLPMLLQGRHVGHQGEMAGLLTDTGFRIVASRSSSLFPMAPLQVLFARKEIKA